MCLRGVETRDSWGVRERRRSRRWGGYLDDKLLPCYWPHSARMYRTCNVWHFQRPLSATAWATVKRLKRLSPSLVLGERREGGEPQVSPAGRRPHAPYLPTPACRRPRQEAPRREQPPQGQRRRRRPRAAFLPRRLRRASAAARAAARTEPGRRRAQARP